MDNKKQKPQTESTAMPAVLSIIGLNIELFARGEEDSSLDGKMGYCDYKRNQIVLSNESSPTQMRETAVHEVLHAVDHAVQGDLSEKEVHRLARALYAVLHDNPEFVYWLLA